jgi:hypothetical protein
MSKKHFIALADVIRETEPDSSSPKFEQWLSIRDALADFCKSQNANFNRERWLAYIAGECGPNGGAK